jgi:Phage integrase, N-terminal SAM-like domain
MGAAEVTAFLTALAVRDRVTASIQNQALNALLFLYREILGVELPWLDDLVRAKRPQHLPTVLTRDEVRAVLERLDGRAALDGAPALRGGPSTPGMLPTANQGRRFRDESDHDPRREGRQGPDDDAARHGQGRPREAYRPTFPI